MKKIIALKTENLIAENLIQKLEDLKFEIRVRVPINKSMGGRNSFLKDKLNHWIFLPFNKYIIIREAENELEDSLFPFDELNGNKYDYRKTTIEKLSEADILWLLIT